VIVPHLQIQTQVEELYREGGLPKGTTTGWLSLDKLYTVGLAQWTLITGPPHSGKSEWLDALMVNLAKQEEWVFVIYSPENWPLALHHSKILEKYVGKPFGPGPTPRMDEEELEEAEAWMRGKFRFARPNRPDIYSILMEAVEVLRRIMFPGFFSVIIVLGAVLSWFSPDPYNPLVQAVYALSEPVLLPFRRVIPNVGGLDLSPLVALLCFQALGTLGQEMVLSLMGR